jgi:hypothetical protein
MTPTDILLIFDDQLPRGLQKRDLESVLQELRDFEMARPESAGLSVKESDDASVGTCLYS